MNNKEITFMEVSRETYDLVNSPQNGIGSDSIAKESWFVPTKLNEKETKELLNNRRLSDTPKCFSDISYHDAYLRFIDTRHNRRNEKKLYAMAGFVNHDEDGSEHYFLSKDILKKFQNKIF
jgi:hypothetical protein